MTTNTVAPPPFSSRQKLILLILLGASFMFAIDLTILNVALPVVGEGVGLGLTGLPWIISAYALPAAGFSLVFGRLADLFGRRKLFLGGIALLTASSLLGGFASNAEMLLTARTLQGFAAALAIPAALSLLTTTFAEGAMREKVLGLNGALLAVGFTVGAVAGGTLVDWLSWRAAFFINVPVGLIILLVTPLLIGESTTPDRVRLDLPGAITVTGGLLAVVYAVLEKSVVFGVVGAVLLIAFWFVELRSPAPLAPVRILKRPTVKWGNYAGLISFMAGTGLIFMVTLYLQQVLGYSPLAAGLIFGLPGLAIVPGGVLAGKFIGRFGPRKVLAAGLFVQALAPLPLVYLGTSRSALWILMPALFITFFAHITAIVAYTVTGTSGLPNEEQGLATGLTSMTQQVAVTVGIPIMGSIAATQAVELTGIHLAIGVNVAATLASVLLVWIGLRPRGAQQAPPAPAAQPAEEKLAVSSD
ncbi:MFS transporter [Phytohabitans kaempferiae]|uniref:MFS transporter n=1 Tax=Phytohabitans kaempferiae TaxID=1620943 RepID=A0ABV6M5N1_9ACTN